MTEGEIGVTAGKEIHYLKKGQAILHTPNEFHNLWSEKNAQAGILIFTFSAKHFPPMSERIFTLSDLREPEEILSLIDRCFERRKSKIYVTAVREGQELQAAIVVKRLELFLLSVISHGSEQKRTGRASQPALNYSKAVKFLEENIHRSLSVAEVAKGCNMGEVNLKKTFSLYAGIGVMQYFNRLKVRSAVTMLSQGATVREAAEALGFLNQNYFCTVFTRIMGVSPKHYKGEG